MSYSEITSVFCDSHFSWHTHSGCCY